MSYYFIFEDTDPYSIENYFSEGLISCKKLLLAGQSIASIHENAFHKLQNCRLLDMSNNQLGFYDTDNTVNNDLSDDSSGDLTDDLIECISEDEDYENTADAGKDDVLPTMYSDIDLKIIETIPTNVFRNMNRLEEVNFSQNEFYEIPALALSKVHSLKVLLMDSNSVKDIPVQFGTRGEVIAEGQNRKGHYNGAMSVATPSTSAQPVTAVVHSERPLKEQHKFDDPTVAILARLESLENANRIILEELKKMQANIDTQKSTNEQPSVKADQPTEEREPFKEIVLYYFWDRYINSQIL